MDTASFAIHDLEAVETREAAVREVTSSRDRSGPRCTNSGQPTRPLASGEQSSPRYRAFHCLLRFAWSSSAVRCQCVTLWTAVRGPASTVVWQGRTGDRPPYADFYPAFARNQPPCPVEYLFVDLLHGFAANSSSYSRRCRFPVVHPWMIPTISKTSRAN